MLRAGATTTGCSLALVACHKQPVWSSAALQTVFALQRGSVFRSVQLPNLAKYREKRQFSLRAGTGGCLHARAFASFAYKSPLAVRQTGGGLAPVVQRAQRARKPQRWPRNDCETHQNDVGLALRFVSHDSTLFYAQGCAVRARRKPGSPQLPPIWACLLQTPKGERTK